MDPLNLVDHGSKINPNELSKKSIPPPLTTLTLDRLNGSTGRNPPNENDLKLHNFMQLGIESITSLEDNSIDLNLEELNITIAIQKFDVNKNPPWDSSRYKIGVMGENNNVELSSTPKEEFKKGDKVNVVYDIHTHKVRGANQKANEIIDQLEKQGALDTITFSAHESESDDFKEKARALNHLDKPLIFEKGSDAFIKKLEVQIRLYFIKLQMVKNQTELAKKAEEDSKKSKDGNLCKQDNLSARRLQYQIVGLTSKYHPTTRQNKTPTEVSKANENQISPTKKLEKQSEKATEAKEKSVKVTEKDDNIREKQTEVDKEHQIKAEITEKKADVDSNVKTDINIQKSKRNQKKIDSQQNRGEIA